MMRRIIYQVLVTGVMKKNAYIMNNFTGQRTKENIENVYSSSMLFF